MEVPERSENVRFYRLKKKYKNKNNELRGKFKTETTYSNGKIGSSTHEPNCPNPGIGREF